MSGSDNWGLDPQVQIMRGVFSDMEKEHDRLLGSFEVSSFDLRLRRWRREALQAFEKTWSRAGREGLSSEEKQMGYLYGHCLARVLLRNGLSAPTPWEPPSPVLSELLEEVLP